MKGKIIKTFLMLVFSISFMHADISGNIEGEWVGTIYDEFSIAATSDAEVSIVKDIVKITYPPFNCETTKYNVENFSKEKLKEECYYTTQAVKNAGKIYPKKQCADTYKILEGQVKIIGENHCYDFSYALYHIWVNDNDYMTMHFYKGDGFVEGGFKRKK